MKPVLDPEVLHRCARAGVGKPKPEMFHAVVDALVDEYGTAIVRPEIEWVFNNAGGAMGQMALLHASLNEYLILFGTPIGTEGHSGRYVTQVWDFMFHGEMWCYIEGETERTIYRPGDAAYLGKNQVKGYVAKEEAWMLEYGRGPIWTMLPFGLADSMLSTLDLVTVGRTLKMYGRLVMRELRRPKGAARAASDRREERPPTSRAA